MADPTAQMGFQVGQTALKHGTEYVEQNVSTSLPGISPKLITIAVQSIRQFLRPQTLLQCLELICCKQTLSGAIPLEAQAMVTKAVYRAERTRRMVLTTEGRHQ